MLNEFVVQHGKAIHARGKAEEEEDFQAINKQATVTGTHP